MGRYTWGKTASALALAAAVAAVSGCSSSDDDKVKPAAATPGAVTVTDATTEFQAAVTKFDEDGGCLEKTPGTCWEQMQALVEPARGLRKAMNAEKSVGPDFWTEAYALIDTMEKGIAVGEDKGATAVGTNRPDVLGSAHDLSDWLDENPIK
ncbi:hypothetical protein [Streptomyces sp. SP18BB07]|uniref:hypothetical protein n=1 Tax=Streptomyces sp. SP18BB07 TaxID=3002522 RepID=UPI002E79693E|nr:hypothetical protein [Streptomyces sp. SP18BB07]MEE1764385.1 hypothetical protein [Streptomyces sp. SP18BB07]